MTTSDNPSENISNNPGDNADDQYDDQGDDRGGSAGHGTGMAGGSSHAASSTAADGGVIEAPVREISQALIDPDSGRSITAEHAEFLAKQAISPGTFLATGGFSVAEVEQLPVDLRWGGAPGLLFCHTRPDGRSIYQYRPDNPQDGKKYIQQARAEGDPDGPGSILSVHPWMAPYLGRPGATVVMVEGTKQYLAFVEIAQALAADTETYPNGIFAFGVQGCQNWSQDGFTLPEMGDILDGAERFIILFDADYKTNRAVYDAAVRARDYATTLGVPENEVRFADLSGIASASSKAGLDDVLGRYPAGLRRERIMRGIMAKATSRLGRAPAKKAAPKALVESKVIVDWDNGTILRVKESFDFDSRSKGEAHGEELQREVLAQFAARIDRTTAIIDDLNGGIPEIQHDLTVRLEDMRDTSGEMIDYPVLAVPDSAIRDVAYWRNQAGDGIGSRRTADTSDKGSREIENAVREFKKDEALYERAYRRTGWFFCKEDETWRYLTPNGAIGPDGRAEGPRSMLENRIYQKCYVVADPAAYTLQEHRAALAEFLSIKDRLGNPTVWYAVVGAMAFAATGVPPRSGIIVAGGHGSGKTVVTQTASSAFGPGFHSGGGDIMGSMNGTANAIGAHGNGLHHSVVMVDDVRRHQTPKQQDDQNNGMEQLIRKSYEGGSAGRARQRVDRRRDGRIVTDAPDAAWPLVIFTGEYIPSAEQVGSSVERLLSITVTKKDTMKPGETENLKRISASGRPAIAWSGYLRWLAQQIAAAGGHEQYVAALESARTQFGDGLAQRYGDLSARTREVSAPPAIGWALLMDYALSLDIITEDQYDALTRDCIDRISEAAAKHSRIELSEDLTEPERVLAQIRAAISSGDARFEGETENAHRPVVARRIERTFIYDARGEKIYGHYPCVALNPDALARVIAIPGGRISNALKELAIRNKDGRVGWTVNINGVKLRNAILLTEETWGTFSDDIADDLDEVA